ncbi:hypothetical protein Tco_0802387 [Tanacetum coccineum]|uniref:Uncharacterized protein n=1 Tax=Tanacetum coccineum TaxID=301880 RepID=A0ABQ4ZYM9_9ASTR
MRFNIIYKFSDGTLTRILEALDYRVKEFKVKRLNPGMNTRFWTQKDVTRSKEFIAAIEKRLKTRRIYQNLECFVGGRWVLNSLVHSLRALSTLRRSSLRTASAAAKPCQGDSSEFYLIAGRIPDDLQHSFRNSNACYHDPEKCEHAGPKVTTSHGGITTTRMIKRFTMADDLKESSKITQVKGTKFKDHYIMYKEIKA